jgi:AraC-like DNA-binding protein
MVMTKRQTTASADLVRVLLKYAAALGLELNGLWSGAGLGPQGPPAGPARIPIAQFNALWQAVARRAGDPAFGLHLAEASASLPGGSLVLMVMANCPTLGDAMRKLIRYHGLATDFVQLRLAESGRVARYSWQPIQPDLPLDRHYAEAVLCGLVLMLRHLSEGKMRLVEIRFRHPRPADTSEHARILDCPLAFSQPRNELALHREDLALPIFLANPELLARLEGFAQEMLDRLSPDESWAGRVTDLIGQTMLRGDRPALEAIASELAISPRHLQNKLRAEGTTYRALLDELRRETALKYLQEPDVPLVDLAFLLGYSEQSAFNHAFKRWTGASPQMVRERVLANTTEE